MATRPDGHKAMASHRAPRRFDWRALLYLTLRALGFVATALLLSWGVMVLALLALGDFSFDGLMAQLANLATRYVAAGVARQMQFKLIVGVANMILAAALIVLRRGALLPSTARRNPADA